MDFQFQRGRKKRGTEGRRRCADSARGRVPPRGRQAGCAPRPRPRPHPIYLICAGLGRSLFRTPPKLRDDGDSEVADAGAALYVASPVGAGVGEVRPAQRARRSWRSFDTCVWGFARRNEPRNASCPALAQRARNTAATTASSRLPTFPRRGRTLPVVRRAPRAHRMQCAYTS